MSSVDFKHLYISICTMINTLREELPKLKIIQGDALKERYVHIWKMHEGLNALAVVLPETTAQLSKILSLCHDADQAVVVHGGLTNLVGSTECTSTDLVISLERMNKIIELDSDSRTLIVEAGTILENIHKEVENHDLLFPLNFGAKGSAQIGGIISTNAGGLRVFRFGMTRQLVLGLEVVLADGTVISSLKKIIKDNSGYDLKHMFIGSEGTLGIITKAVLKLVEKPKSRQSCFVAFDDYTKVVQFLKYMDKGLAGTLSGYELIWGNTYKAMTSPPAQASPPLAHGHTYYVLLESLGADPNYDKNRMLELLESALENNQILDACIADGDSDLNWFWTIREDVHVIKSRCAIDHHFDISMPISLIGELISDMKNTLEKIDGVHAVYPFGHIADGNMHLIVDRKSNDPELIKSINDTVYLPLKDVNGSVSAEHGIGIHKKAYLHISRSESEIQLMRLLKNKLDPKGILNQGKIFD